MMEATFDLKLGDVLEEKDELPVKVVVSQGRSDDGVVVQDAQGRNRVVVENHLGVLTVYVWKTIEDADYAHDPITVELETE